MSTTRLRLVRGELLRAAGQAAAAVPLRRGDAHRGAAGVRAGAHRARRRPRGRRRVGRAAGAEVVRQVAGSDATRTISISFAARSTSRRRHRARLPEPTPPSGSPPRSRRHTTPPAPSSGLNGLVASFGLALDRARDHRRARPARARVGLRPRARQSARTDCGDRARSRGLRSRRVPRGACGRRRRSSRATPSGWSTR